MAKTLTFPITLEQYRIRQRDAKRAVDRNYWERRTRYDQPAALPNAEIFQINSLITSQEELNHA